MTKADTSAVAVERLAAFHALSADRYCADDESGLRACAVMTAATLRALLAERDEAIDQRNAADFVLASALAMSSRRSAQRDAARAEVERLNEALIRERHGWQAEVERLRRKVLRAGGAHG